MKNMELWNAVFSTDPKFTKNVSLGKYKFTDIDSMWNIRRATELWGPYGTKWKLQNCKYTPIISTQINTVGFMLEAHFIYPDGDFPIAVDMPYDPKGETLKKLQTMCLGKALSRLGFSADVYMGMFEDSAYVKEMEAKYADTATDSGGSGDSPDAVPVASKSGVKKYPEPDPVASGILGSLAQKYMEELASHVNEHHGYVVSFKKLCHAVYDKFNQYPTKVDSIPKIMESVPIGQVIEKNDFLEGIA
jgi:hypothetical protein